MKKIIPSLVFLICFAHFGFSQNLNSYKYVVVPNKYEFLKETNEYKLNALTRFLFEKYGFEAYMEGEIPDDYDINRCNMLYANVVNNSGIFVTRLKVELNDCRNKQVFASEEGTSREKDFKKAYYEALRDAFKSIKTLNYQYSEEKQVSDPLPEKIKTKTDEISNNKAEVPEINNEVPKEEKAVNAPPVQKPIAETSLNKNRTFGYDGNTFYLKENGDNYRFYQQGMEEPFAELIATSRENQFIYSSFSGQGIAYFDKTGNLIVETSGKDGTSAKVKTYKLQK